MTQFSEKTVNEGAKERELTETERYQLLATERRRRVVEYLEEAPATVTLDELAMALAKRDAESEFPDSGSIECIAISLHHTTLPKMDEYGLIDYDPERNRVESIRVERLFDDRPT